MIKLSPRLGVIAGFVEKGETVADVGCDHGFLPLYLLQAGISPKVIMTDISAGSLNKARQSFTDAYPADFDRMTGVEFDFRVGDGLTPLARAETDAVVMAGMGGLLMTEIMGHDPDKTGSFKKYILQPRNNPGKLRKWLDISGFKIISETLVRERSRICEIIAATPAPTFKEVEMSAADMDDDVMWEYPETLIEHRNALTEEYLIGAIEKQTRIHDRILMGSDRRKLKITEMRLQRLKYLYGRLEK